MRMENQRLVRSVGRVVFSVANMSRPMVMIPPAVEVNSSDIAPQMVPSRRTMSWLWWLVGCSVSPVFPRR
ncbi:hypothetical protein [Dermatophilus congolensis]|uniref:hypothetical protein n=1 Tax=Dermatophilus congolensis TaxID=1863 RepID=UPI0015F05B9D|nr:hypothetical protein [Dermatophilus congolensis]